MLEIIGYYRIRRNIGEGAMGTVYEGWDDRLERPEAVDNSPSLPPSLSGVEGASGAAQYKHR